MSIARGRLTAAVLAALAIAGGCGYRIVGIGGKLPGGVTLVEVPVFENRTSRTDVGQKLTEDFISRLLGAAKVTVATRDEAQARILGTVTSYKLEPISFDTKQKPLENRLTIVMDISLRTSAENRALFGQKAVSVRYDYAVGTNLEQNDKLEEEALREASGLMSQKLVNLMLESF